MRWPWTIKRENARLAADNARLALLAVELRLELQSLHDLATTLENACYELASGVYGRERVEAAINRAKRGGGN